MWILNTLTENLLEPYYAQFFGAFWLSKLKVLVVKATDIWERVHSFTPREVGGLCEHHRITETTEKS